MKINRRQFLRSAVMLGFSSAFVRSTFAQDATATPTPEGMPLQLTGKVRDVHDPVIMKHGDAYYIYHTGPRIPHRVSKDLLEWTVLVPNVFKDTPRWAIEQIKGVTNLWAPDISFFNDKYHLYYSASTFGSNISGIGLATNTTLNPEEEGYAWEDQGIVITSNKSDNYNCIDPNLVIDQEGQTWLAFGSFWSGIKMRRIDYATGKLSEEDTELYSLAQRFTDSGSVEAPFIIHKGDYYYLFVSFDACCQGTASTYRVMVGRSESVLGPYVDRDGVEMLQGGGTQVTFPSRRWKGPGHNSVLIEGDKEWLVYHSYDAQAGGIPTLRITPLQWDDEGWPFITEA